MSETYARDRDTVRTVAGVRTDPSHWANAPVHSFRTWTGDRTMVTWCGLDIDLSAGAFQTRDLISCLQCGQASWDGYWGRESRPSERAGAGGGA